MKRGPSLSQQESNHCHHKNLGSVSQHCPPTTSGIKMTQGGKCLHPSQHTGQILIKPYCVAIEFIGTCHRIIAWQLRLFFKICIESYFASHTSRSHSPCTLQVSTIQTCIHNNINSIANPYYQHSFLSSHKITK